MRIQITFKQANGTVVSRYTYNANDADQVKRAAAQTKVAERAGQIVESRACVAMAQAATLRAKVQKQQGAYA